MAFVAVTALGWRETKEREFLFRRFIRISDMGCDFMWHFPDSLRSLRLAVGMASLAILGLSAASFGSEAASDASKKAKVEEDIRVGEPVAASPPSDRDDGSSPGKRRAGDGGEPGQEDRTAAELAKVMRKSLVKITQVGREGVDGLGTGFVVSEEGLIATNLHVIGEARALRVETAEGRELEVEAVHATDARLDLALLRVDVTVEGRPVRLQALPLGVAATLEQGQRLVAMGNPEGLEFSVVEGVVSAIREVDIEGVPMLQVALPIERGNSGGPVLNGAGEVVGVLTLKSLRTDNLGFAMPVAGVKALIAQPNPVPMERWLTIGVLDRRQWEVLQGGRWSQRAGVIRAESPGEGFGGRTLCLSRDMAWPEETAMEVAVSVRLDDEAGAAGLVFCAEGGDRHYGFYPSGGKLRLTRFEGPDVFSWTILADVDVQGYRKGDWNQLRVRVESEGLRCWVNGELVLELEDAAFRGGRVGLCKFRQTVAEFRGFRTGVDLSPKPVDPALAGKVEAQLEVFLDRGQDATQTAEALVAEEPTAARRLVVERRRELERQAAALRDLERDLHRKSVMRELNAELAKPEPEVSLLRCALLLARFDNPEIEVAGYVKALDRMANELRNDAELQSGVEAAVRRLNRFLFDENGFHGSRTDYQSKSNSYVNEVLDDREGLPITLSVVYLELAKAVGVEGVFGVGLPGKFMVGYRTAADGELQLVDVFERGRLLSVADAERELNDFVEFDPDLLKPARKRDIVVRMIKNLLSMALDEEGTGESGAMPYLDLVISLAPESPPERFARARLRQSSGDKSGAREDVAWLLANTDDLPPGVRGQLEGWLQSLAEP